MFEKYKRYFSDNPEGYWFKRKIWGWGWTPVTWQGSGVILAYLFIVLSEFLRSDRAAHSVSDTFIGAAPVFIVATLILLLICYQKGEKPGWRWGIK